MVVSRTLLCCLFKRTQDMNQPSCAHSWSVLLSPALVSLFHISRKISLRIKEIVRNIS